jgi:hypothetical protein
MKLLPLLLCLAVALLLPACAAVPKKEECATGGSCCAAKGKCDAPGKKHKH